uniref:ER lumen protein-retaining receptor n=1 Tax=Amphiprion percula TaxID=161767 RepID=A0A3P8T147_AMPPE
MEKQVVCRYLWEEPNSLRSRVHHSLPGPAHLLHLTVQHVHEGKTPTTSSSSCGPIFLPEPSVPSCSVVHQVIYIGCSYATVYLIYMKFRATYDGNHDSFRVEFLVVPVGGLAVLINHDFSLLEILWTFSIYLESVAILPQLFMISKTGEAETITTHYLFCLGLYRALYLFNWIWRFYFEGFFDMIAIVAGVVQTVLYCDFFYLYVTKVLKGKKLSLPA